MSQGPQPTQVELYRVVHKKGTVLLSTSLAWLAAAGQKLSLNLAPFLLLNPVGVVILALDTDS